MADNHGNGGVSAQADELGSTLMARPSTASLLARTSLSSPPPRIPRVSV